MDKFFYDIWFSAEKGKYVFCLYVETGDEEFEQFDDELYFDTVEEAEKHKDDLPDFAYHIEQFGDV